MTKITIYDCLSQCIADKSDRDDLVKSCMSECQPQKYTAPLIWVGFYIAGASLVCMIAMATDLFNGLRAKKSWFPCKFFTLNAAISAVLAIALKMPVDLSSSMPCGRDQLMKLSGTALMSVSMGNFMPSLAAMSDPELFANLIALAVFIVPLISNICIQIGTEVIYQGIVVQHVIIICCIILQFALLVSTAIASPTMKEHLDSAYKEAASLDAQPIIKDQLKKHWVMTQTSNPQFVIARSVMCTASGAICLVSVLVLAEAIIQLYITMSKKKIFFFPSSDYEWSANFIVVTQAVAVLVGSISPICRWLMVVWFKFAGWPKSSFQKFWTVEEYWTKRLRELKELQLGLNPRHVKFNKLVRDGKAMFLDIFIKFQTFTVLSCRFLCLVSLVFLLPFMFVYKIIRFDCKNMMFAKEDKDGSDLPKSTKTVKKTIGENTGAEENTDMTWDTTWVLKLDNDSELPNKTIKKIVGVFNGYINKGKKKANLEKADGFDGIEKFNSNFIEGLTKISIDGVYNNPNGVWAMRIVTLSTIVCCIKNIPDDRKFVSMVNNILKYVRYVEKALDAGRKDIDLGDAAMDAWIDVYNSNKWLKEIDIGKEIEKQMPFKTKLEKLKFSQENMEKHGNNRQIIAAAKWMNKTVEIFIQNLLVPSKDGKEIEEQKLYENLCLMVSDIIAACLVNLEKAININISKASIEKRESVVKDAASILGETEDIRQVAKERHFSITDSQDYNEYLKVSWWKVVIKKIPLEEAIASEKAEPPLVKITG
ncbi:uncharacterized protein LOC124928794 [Impatiens glandulifera]|uniref:uncharacterized protein LOC124928794 n=1 Tax=Impatiens glandulifera TaxID=253017 RepID=UPI001FB0A812|nr:uncharacterized protein LOC124928794 [Impatiens glandulifera]